MLYGVTVNFSSTANDGDVFKFLMSDIVNYSPGRCDKMADLDNKSRKRTIKLVISSSSKEEIVGRIYASTKPGSLASIKVEEWS